MTPPDTALPDLSEVANRVYRLEVPIPGMPQMPVVYLIDARPGALIEPGPAAAAPSIRRAMDRIGMNDPSWIIPTHIHVDHAGGTGTLAGLFPGAKVVVHPRGARHLISPARLVESTRLVWGQDFEKHLGPIDPVPEPRLKVAEDGEHLALGDRELQIIHAVGHSPNHIVILDRKVNGLFCGEALGLPRNQFPPVAPYSFDQDIYTSTAERLNALRVDLLFYSHGTAEKETGYLMSRALENARVYSRLVLEAARQGASMEDILALAGDDFRQRFGHPADRAELEIVVAGYIMLYRTEGMLT